MIPTAAYAGWWVGISLSFIVVAVVVLLMAVILIQAQRIATEAQVAGDALELVRDCTDPLREVAGVNDSAVAILKSARALRRVLMR